MTEIRTENFTAKDMFNAATALSLKSVIGQQITILGIWVCERPDLDGNVKPVANLKCDDGNIYGTISDTVIRSVTALPELLEAGPVTVNVETRPGTKGRDYIVITLV